MEAQPRLAQAESQTFELSPDRSLRDRINALSSAVTEARRQFNTHPDGNLAIIAEGSVLALSAEEQEEAIIARRAENPLYQAMLTSFAELRVAVQQCEGSERIWAERMYIDALARAKQAFEMGHMNIGTWKKGALEDFGPHSEFFTVETVETSVALGGSYIPSPQAAIVHTIDTLLSQHGERGGHTTVCTGMIARLLAYPELRREVPGRDQFHLSVLKERSAEVFLALSRHPEIARPRTMADHMKAEFFAFAALFAEGDVRVGQRTADDHCGYKKLALEKIDQLIAYWQRVFPPVAELFATVRQDPEKWIEVYGCYEADRTAKQLTFDASLDERIHALGEPFLGYEIPHYEQLLLKNADTLITQLCADALVTHPNAPLVFFDHSARPLAWLLKERWRARQDRGEALPQLPPIRFMSDDKIKDTHARSTAEDPSVLPWPFPDQPEAVVFIDDFTAFGRVRNAVMELKAPFHKYFVPFFNRGDDYVSYGDSPEEKISYMDATYRQGTPWHILPMTVGVWTLGKGEGKETLSSGQAMHMHPEVVYKSFLMNAFQNHGGIARADFYRLVHKCTSPSEMTCFDGADPDSVVRDTALSKRAADEFRSRFMDSVQHISPADRIRLQIAMGVIDFTAEVFQFVDPAQPHGFAEKEFAQYIHNQEKKLRARLSKLAQL
ncbi:MAG: hypothetical protein KIH62_004290 [Candidatus Kerfeldbacteria bacterium]|nr:hypothetical protein [Candidatus Kerfeldbacteria bacterium]